jgi:Phage terminase large subunit (GpA)
MDAAAAVAFEAGRAPQRRRMLAHTVIWGSPLADDTWSEVEALLRQRWKHPRGGMLRVDVAVFDAGDGGHFDAVMAFCNARLGQQAGNEIEQLDGFPVALICCPSDIAKSDYLPEIHSRI